jgi:hypothetical protein
VLVPASGVAFGVARTLSVALTLSFGLVGCGHRDSLRPQYGQGLAPLET